MRKASLAVLVVTLAAVSGWSAAGAPPPQPASAATLYERLGGVFGIAPLVDGLVDRLWDNKTLLANPQFVAVRRELQKPVVKFLLTASVCHAAGGPEQDLGQSLLTFRFSLRLTEDDWLAVWPDIEATIERSRISAELRPVVLNEIAHLKGQIVMATRPVVTGGSRPPSRLGDVSEDPDEQRQTLYLRLGHSVGIAGIVDVFVERMLMNKTITANPDIKAAAARVTTAGLKYQLTALLCQATGGPERYVRHPVLPRGTTVRVGELEWSAMLAEMRQAMAMRYVGQMEQDELLALVGTVKRQVVTGR